MAGTVRFCVSSQAPVPQQRRGPKRCGWLRRLVRGQPGEPGPTHSISRPFGHLVVVEAPGRLLGSPAEAAVAAASVATVPLLELRDQQGHDPAVFGPVCDLLGAHDVG